VFRKELCISALLTLVIPLAAQYDFVATPVEGCTPLKVKFQFVSSATVDSIATFEWDFGNGLTSNAADPDTVIYLQPGLFTPSLRLNENNDLLLIKADYVNVHRTVPAQFSYYDTVTYFTYVFAHLEPLDNSATYSFSWDFEDVGTRNGRRQIITFPALDSFLVTLTVTDNYGCTSTHSESVLVMEEITVQNVFSPNGDEINKYFVVSSNGAFPLRLQIFTSTGIFVYKGEGTVITWDGTSASGAEMPAGIYFYSLEATRGDPNRRFTKAGFLYLFK